jgi:hypothetical protein
VTPPVPGPGERPEVDVLVVGGGPAGLMAAETAGRTGASVVIIDHMRGLGRKLLLAGRSGLNLTHIERHDRLRDRFRGSAAPVVRASVDAFDTAAVRDWCAGLGTATFVGSSGRVFPEGLRSGPLLRAWLARLEGLGVAARPGTRLLGITRSGDALVGAVAGAGGVLADVSARSIVLALGGASWPRTGSDGAWPGLLAAHGVGIEPLAPANAGVRIEWSEHVVRHEGAALKNAAVAVAGHRVRGEPVITRRGMEGGPIYALGPELRSIEPVVVTIDLRADADDAVLLRRIERAGSSASLHRRLSASGIEPAGRALVNEAIIRGWADRPGTPADVLGLVRAVPVHTAGLAPIDRAISSSGGVAGSSLDTTGMLVALPGVWACGEMCDWEAPTGGYLIHGCLATGRVAGAAAATWAGP